MKPLKFLTMLSALALLSACASGFPPGPNTGQSEYEYIGCHKVSTLVTVDLYQNDKLVSSFDILNNPAADGSVAFGPFGLDPVATGNFVFFKQKNADGTVSKVNAEPC